MTALIVRPRQTIDQHLALFQERWTRDGVMVLGTHCLYPDGQNVAIELRPSIGGKWDLTDGAGGWDVLFGATLDVSPATASRVAAKVAKTSGAVYESGAWWMRSVEPEQLPGAVMWLANASQEWVRRLMSERHRKDATALEEMLRTRLSVRFGNSSLDPKPEYQGASTTVYDFSAILHLPGKKTAVFQVVTPHGSSLNSAYRKMDDVLKAEDPPDFVEAIIEDTNSWPAADLVLLRTVSTGVTDLQTGLNRRLERLAA